MAVVSAWARCEVVLRRIRRNAHGENSFLGLFSPVEGDSSPLPGLKLISSKAARDRRRFCEIRTCLVHQIWLGLLTKPIFARISPASQFCCHFSFLLLILQREIFCFSSARNHESENERQREAGLACEIFFSPSSPQEFLIDKILTFRLNSMRKMRCHVWL